MVKSWIDDYPLLKKEWDNDKNEKGPENYSYGSHYKAWWKCSNPEVKCNCHSWQTSICCRTRNNNSPKGCPFCSGRVVCEHDNLKIIYPELCEEWNYDKNEMGPENYSKKSGKQVWWKCLNPEVKCKCHIWKTDIKSRTNGNGCPFCNGHHNKKICKHDNLKTNYPKLCREWSNRNILGPDSYSYGSKYKAWWICQINKTHNWLSSIKDRTTRSKGCPFCINKTEAKLKQWFEDNKYNHLYQAKFDWSINPKTNKYLPFDFCLEEFKFIVELDGQQHFYQTSNWINPKITQQNDIYKMQQALNNGYTIIRILQTDVWKDKNDWENKLREQLHPHKIADIIYLYKEEEYRIHRSQYAIRESYCSETKTMKRYIL